MSEHGLRPPDPEPLPDPVLPPTPQPPKPDPLPPPFVGPVEARRLVRLVAVILVGRAVFREYRRRR